MFADPVVSARVNRGRRILLWTVAAFWAFPSWAEPKGEVIFVTGEWAPFTGERLPDRGVFTRYAELLAQDMGVKASIQFVPWLRAEAMLKTGEAFAAFPYSKTSSRSKHFDFSAAVTQTVSKLFFYKSRFPNAKTTPSLEELKAYSIGVTSGSGMQEKLGQHGIKLETAVSEEGLMRMLLAERFDMAAVNEHVGWHYLKRLKAHPEVRLTNAELPFTRYDTMFMVSRTYPGREELMDRMNRSIARLAQSKVYEGLVAKIAVNP